ncbi:hypothetical protein C8J56DRAFT_891929 [Mycena floridula]|nr:hypothetical protein C8J56DRAFT_891929 [Mycena floridula]
MSWSVLLSSLMNDGSFWIGNSKPRYNRPLPPPGTFNDTPLNPVKPPALTSDTSTSSSPPSKHTHSSKKEPDPVKMEIISIEEQEQNDFALAIQRSLTDSSGIRQGPVASSSMLSQSTAPRHSQSSYSPSPIKLPYSSASISLNDQFWAQFLAENHGNGFPDAPLSTGSSTQPPLSMQPPPSTQPPPRNVKKRKLLSSPEPATSQDQIVPGVLHSEADTDFVNLLNLLGGDGTRVSGASAAQLCSVMVQCNACQGVTWCITFSRHECPSASHNAPLTFWNNKGKEKDTFIDLSFD